jgi:hypothetical protein
MMSRTILLLLMLSIGAAAITNSAQSREQSMSTVRCDTW